MKKSTRNVVSQKTRHQLNLLLQELLTMREDGFVEYPLGWNDRRVAEKIAQESGEMVKDHHVQDARMAVFGKLRDRGTIDPGKSASLEARVFELELSFAQLCKELNYDPRAHRVQLKLAI